MAFKSLSMLVHSAWGPAWDAFSPPDVGLPYFYLVTWVSLQVKHINRLMLIFWIRREILTVMMVLRHRQLCWLVTIYMLPMLEIQGL